MDFMFLDDDSTLATCGNEPNGHNVKVWSFLIPTAPPLYSFKCHDGGALCMCYLPSSKILITGGTKGDVVIFELENYTEIYSLQPAQDGGFGPVYCLLADEWSSQFFVGTGNGQLLAYDSKIFSVRARFNNLFEKQSFFNHPSAMGMVNTYGVTSLAMKGRDLYATGSDGSVKLLRKVLSGRMMQLCNRKDSHYSRLVAAPPEYTL
jgi:WD40 repeat protein